MKLALLKEKFLGKQDIWDIDYSEPKFDYVLTTLSGSKLRGSIRLSMDLFYTNEEWEQISQKILQTPMP